ncbi:UPF0659 protein, partial [Lachnellula suecica]
MQPHILLLGGHGKVSQLLTPKLLSRSWTVTSLIRSPSQRSTIEALGANQPGKLNIHIASLQDIKSQSDAQKILDEVKPTWVVWSAGAGGKGGAEMTNAIDRDACIAFIRASVATPSITKFLLVSALSERRARASWWNDEDYALVQKMNTEIMPAYYKAKLAADETLTVLARERGGFGYIVLRPGGLSDKKEMGKVQLGKTK